MGETGTLGVALYGYDFNAPARLITSNESIAALLAALVAPSMCSAPLRINIDPLSVSK